MCYHARMASRRRGGQPGNLNALKHGFYSAHFTADELADLDNATALTLPDVIQVLQVQIRRVLNLSRNQTDLDSATTTLAALGAASIRLAGLLRTQKYLGADPSDATAALQEALAAVTTDLCLA